jgi:hypothetical protein
VTGDAAEEVGVVTGEVLENSFAVVWRGRGGEGEGWRHCRREGRELGRRGEREWLLASERELSVGYKELEIG